MFNYMRFKRGGKCQGEKEKPHAEWAAGDWGSQPSTLQPLWTLNYTPSNNLVNYSVLKKVLMTKFLRKLLMISIYVQKRASTFSLYKRQTPIQRCSTKYLSKMSSKVSRSWKTRKAWKTVPCLHTTKGDTWVCLTWLPGSEPVAGKGHWWGNWWNQRDSSLVLTNVLWLWKTLTTEGAE